MSREGGGAQVDWVDVASAALLALATNDGEGHHDPIAYFQFIVCFADLNHLAHELVAHDVPRFHAGHESIEKV